MDLSSAQPGRRAKRNAKRRKETPRPAGSAGPFLTPYTAYPSNKRWVYYPSKLPFVQPCLQFVPTQPGPFPEDALTQLLSLARDVCSKIHATLFSEHDIAFVCDFDPEQDHTLVQMIRAGRLVITGSTFGITAEVRHLRALVRDALTKANYSTPGLTTSDSDDDSSGKEGPSEDESPTPPRKVAAPSLPAITNPAKVSRTSAQPSQTSAPASDNALPPSQPSDPTKPASATEAVPSTQRPRVQGRRRNIYRSVDFSAMVVTIPQPEPCQTVIFRTQAADDDLRRAHPAKLMKELSVHGEYTGLRDIREGGLAVDFPPGTSTNAVLAVTSLAGIPVSAALPAAASTNAQAVLSGVHPELTEEEILAEITTQPPSKVTAAKRLARPGQESWSVKLSFEGSTVPERALLFNRSRKLKSYMDRPLQCLNCARYGHSARVCRSKTRCLHCAKEHTTANCQSALTPTCGNCGGPHPASSQSCAARAFQQKVCQVRATSQVPYRTAKLAVSKAAKTYSAALRGGNPGSQARPTPTTALPRPPQQQPAQPAADPSAILTVFQSLMTLLSTTVPCHLYATVAHDVTQLFQSLVPAADFHP